jgi:hypothetical protein
MEIDRKLDFCLFVCFLTCAKVTFFCAKALNFIQVMVTVHFFTYQLCRRESPHYAIRHWQRTLGRFPEALGLLWLWRKDYFINPGGSLWSGNNERDYDTG